MKLIHCADLHLDAKMETHFNSEISKVRKAEIKETFNRLVEYANDLGAKCIMISGDMFDVIKIQEKTKQFVLGLINKYPHIDFIYLSGNHDECNFIKELSEDEIPTNLKSFNNNWHTYDYGNITITGLELGSTSIDILSTTLDLDPNKYNIVMLHGQEASYQSNTVEKDAEIINLKALENKNIDYLALGHIHSYKEGLLPPKGIYAYSGCLEGRGFDECGDKGCIVLEIDDDTLKAKHQFVKLAKRTFHEINIDITGLTSVLDISEKIKQTLKTISPDDIVKVVLIGSYTADTKKDLTHFNSVINDYCFFGKLVDKTKIKINVNDYKYDISLKGEFIRTTLSEVKNEEDAGDIIMMGIQALSGEDIE